MPMQEYDMNRYDYQKQNRLISEANSYEILTDKIL